MCEQHDDTDMILKVGDRFASIEALQCKLEEYKQATCTDYWNRDNRTLRAAAKRVPERVRDSNSDLKYYYIKYCCVYGGQELKQKPNVSGRKTSTQKQGCGANLYFTLSKDKQCLFLKSMVTVHTNHTMDTSTLQSSCGAHIRFSASADGSALEVQAMNEEHNHETSQQLVEKTDKCRATDAPARRNKPIKRRAPQVTYPPMSPVASDTMDAGKRLRYILERPSDDNLAPSSVCETELREEIVETESDVERHSDVERQSDRHFVLSLLGPLSRLPTRVKEATKIEILTMLFNKGVQSSPT